MSILNNDIRAWWIQKSDSCNIANKVEFCDFKPTVHDKGYDWIRVISLDDFHKQTNINITRWVEVCRELQKLKEQNKTLREALEFYAEIKNYDYIEQYNNAFTVIDPVDCEKFVDKWHDITFIGGKRAREALAKVNNENN